MNYPSRRRSLSAAVLYIAVAGILRAQAIPPASTVPAKDETVVLPPYEVVPDDVGYQAGNTTSGSRLNSSLRDTAASISVFTPEFLSDIAANNLSEMLAYAPDLRSITGGQGEYTMEFLRYEEVPSHLAQKVIDQEQKAEEAVH